MEQNSYTPNQQPSDTSELVQKALEANRHFEQTLREIETETNSDPVEDEQKIEVAAQQWHRDMDGQPDYIQAFSWAALINCRELVVSQENPDIQQ